jgi:hypothetical protein
MSERDELLEALESSGEGVPLTKNPFGRRESAVRGADARQAIGLRASARSRIQRADGREAVDRRPTGAPGPSGRGVRSSRPMARLEGVQRAPSLFAAAVFRFARRRLRNVPEPLRIQARHPRVFGGVVRMELALDKARALPATLKTLVSIRVAMLIGCPF